MQKRFGTKDSVRCSEFRGGRFSEVANVLQVWDFQSVTRIVRSRECVRSGRFYYNYIGATCSSMPLVMHHTKISCVDLARG